MIQGPDLPRKYTYYMIAQYVIIGSVLVFAILNFAVPPPIVEEGDEFPAVYIIFLIGQGFAIVLDVVLVIFIVSVIPMRKRQKAQEAAMNIDFSEGVIEETPNKKEDFFLGFKQIEEIHLDWDSDATLLQIFQSPEFEEYKRELLRDEAVKQFHKRAMDNETEVKDFLEELSKQKKELNKKLEKETDLEKMEKLEQDLLEIDNEIYYTKLTKVPLKDFLLEALTSSGEFGPEIQTNKEVLKNFHFYYVVLYEKERWEDEEEDEGFERALLLLPGPYSTLHKTSPYGGLHDGWRIDVRSCVCYWLLFNYFSDQLPLLYLRFSENMTGKEVDLLTTMRSQSATYIQLKVMEKWLYILSSLPERLRKEKAGLQSRAEQFRNAFATYIQEVANDDVIFGKFVENEDVRQQRIEAQKYKKRSQIAFSIIIILGIVFGIAMLMIFSSEPPQDVATLIYTYTYLKFGGM